MSLQSARARLSVLVARTYCSVPPEGVPTSCTPRERPLCPPCESAPPPPCRRPATSTTTAVRVVCCPPPAGSRPPCAPPSPACPITCDTQLSRQDAEAKSCPVFPGRGKCSSNLDRVARRLAAAESARREHYEREAAEPPPRYQPAPAAYRLPGERHCARATDGQDYMYKKSEEKKARCGPDRTPPPPTPLHLDSTQRCELNVRPAHLDPCAHLPRVFVEIDRSAKASPDSETAKELPSKGSSTCQRPMDGNKKRNWCESPPKLANIAPECREPSLMERLRRRGAADVSRQTRKYHSGACANLPGRDNLREKPTLAADHQDKLAAVMRERDLQQECARGRRVGLPACDTKSQGHEEASGCVELQVPHSGDTMKVRVTVGVTRSQARPSLPASPRLVRASGGRGSDTWLSIKNIQKKLAECGKKLDPVETPQKNPSPPKNPCAVPDLKHNGTKQGPGGSSTAAPTHPKTSRSCYTPLLTVC